MERRRESARESLSRVFVRLRAKGLVAFHELGALGARRAVEDEIETRRRRLGGDRVRLYLVQLYLTQLHGARLDQLGLR